LYHLLTQSHIRLFRLNFNPNPFQKLLLLLSEPARIIESVNSQAANSQPKSGADKDIKRTYLSAAKVALFLNKVKMKLLILLTTELSIPDGMQNRSDF